MNPFQFLLLLNLTSPDALVEQLRRQGAREIGIERVQMDSDPEFEALVRYEKPGEGIHAVILDAGREGWMRAGGFNAWWSLTEDDRKRFVELRPAVEAPIQDVFVRTRSGGTEEERITLEIYRLREGKLVNVLSIVEYLSAMEHPSGDVFNTTVTLHSRPGRIVSESVRRPGGRRVCTVYRWEPNSFRFQPATGELPDPCQ